MFAGQSIVPPQLRGAIAIAAGVSSSIAAVRNEPSSRRIEILRTEAGIEISWQEGSVQYSPGLLGSWVDLPVAGPFSLSPTGKTGFFRINTND
jgi:hypothetical protein